MDINQHHNNINNIANSNIEYPSKKFNGKGIVTTGGGLTYFTCAWILINMLRHFKCELPIEVWYLGKHEMNDHMLHIMQQIPGVTCIDAYEISKTIPVKKLDGWELKVYAIKNSSFEEVMFIDSDNVPTKDPTYLFNSKQYLECGSVFWTDNSKFPTAYKNSWEVCDVTPVDGLEFESGQLLLNKSKCWKALELTSYLNENSNFFYRFLFGDKDTFRMAWLKTNTPFKSPTSPYCLKNNEVIYQSDFNEDVIFQHRSGSKWKLNGINSQPSKFQYNKECSNFLMQLRQKWQGTIRSIPKNFNEIEKQAYDEICKIKKYKFDNGQRKTLTTLISSFKLGIGISRMEDTWNLYSDNNDIPVLTLGKLDRTTCFLRKENDIWTGLYLFDSRKIVTLTKF